MREFLELQNVKDKKEELFGQQEDIIREIYRKGFANYAESLQDLPNAFDLEKHKPAQDFNRCLCCMDERTPYGLHAAGGGLFLERNQLEKMRDKGKIDSISSHEGHCKAVEIFCQQNGISTKDLDETARRLGEEKAKELGLKHIHLKVKYPFHFARVCYYDGTGEFNYDGVKGLPAGFVVGRKHMTDKLALLEVKVAGNIMVSDPDFAKFYPFLLVAIGSTAEEMERLKKELKKTKDTFADKIAIDGFVTPMDSKK